MGKFFKAILNSYQINLFPLIQLKSNELKLKRSFKDSKHVLVNGKKVKIEDFHETIANIGSMSESQLQIHHLGDEEVQKLGLLVGDDLWNMLKKTLGSEKLIKNSEDKPVSYSAMPLITQI